MIAKWIERKVENDNYRALALYVAGHTEQKPGEKVLHTWFAGCAGENFTEALMEIDAVQSLNTRTLKSKSYHLMLSFRPEDEEKLTQKILDSIEHEFAQALGYTTHQRCCGVHRNTNNLHMHIAYNMIHPEKFTRHEPFGDFKILSKVCREIEQKYGLTIDNGMTEGQTPTRVNIRAQSMEAHAGQQSFQSYAQSRSGILLASLVEANTWQALHVLLSRYGMGIKPRNSGAVVYNLHGKQHIKASSLHRDFSLKALEKRLGAYETPGPIRMVELERYMKRPLQKNADRENLYQAYVLARQAKDEKYRELKALRTGIEKQKSATKDKWQQYRQNLYQNSKLASQDRWVLVQESYLHQKSELQKLDEPRREFQKTIREQYPFSTWGDYLKSATIQGNETALEVLRSSKKSDGEIVSQAQNKEQQKRHDVSDQMRELLQNKSLGVKGKKKILPFLKLQEKRKEKLTLTISPSGVVIIGLPSGATVRDTGKEVFYALDDPMSGAVAKDYAQIKWGKRTVIDDNKIVFSKGQELTK